MKRALFLVWIVFLFLFGVFSETPAQISDFFDQDGDGVYNGEESGPDGDNPAYDGNGDGQADWLQANVASFYDVTGHYVTLEVPEPGVLRDVFPMTASGVPENTSFPCGLFHFIVEDLSEPDVTITLPASFSVNSYYNFGRTPDNTDEHWYEFMYDNAGKTGAVISGNQIVLHFVDGERGDDDLNSTNQIVIGEGGPAVISEDPDPAEYQITASAGNGGTISPSGEISVLEGDSLTFSIDPDSGYEIKDVLVDGDSVGPVDAYTFKNVKSDHTIQAGFSGFEYQVTASAGDGGTISPSGDISVDYGDSLTFSIDPGTGYEIKDVLVDGDSVGPVDTYTFKNVKSDHTIQAGFSRFEYQITASAGNGGTISPSGILTVDYGDSLSFSIYPYTGYEIEDVLVNGDSVGPVDAYTFKNVKSNQTIVVEFSRLEYQVTASAGDGGTISPSGDISVYYGGSTAFSIDPDTGYEIEDVLVNGESEGPVETYTFSNVRADQSIAAAFARLEYQVTASAGDGGAISPSGDVPVYYGDSPVFSISPDSGYEIEDVLVNGESAGPVESYTFSDVDADQSIAAAFARLKYQVTASAGDGGTISPSGGIPVYYGDSPVFSIYSYTDYEIEDVLVNGESVGPVDAYTFEPVTSDQTIEVLYTYAPQIVEGDPDGDGIDGEEEAGPAGDDPDYDGNGDGLPDCEQANVASFYDVHNQYVTIDVEEPGVLKDVFPMTEEDAPEDVEFPCGLFHFIVEGLTDPNITITLPESMSANSYYKFGPTPDNTDAHWYEFMYDRESGTGAVIDGNRITLYFVDGERGDDDLDSTNQIVIDQGGPAVASGEALESTSSGSEEEEEEGCFITATLQGSNALERWALFGLMIIFLVGCIRKSKEGPD